MLAAVTAFPLLRLVVHPAYQAEYEDSSIRNKWCKYFLASLAFCLGMAIIVNMDKQELASYVIDSLGGTSAVARLCEIEPPSVTGWKTHGIPKPWIKYFRCVRPDVFKADAINKHLNTDAAA